MPAIDDFHYDVFVSQVELPPAERSKMRFDDWEIEAGANLWAQIDDRLERSRILLLCMLAQTFGSDRTRLEAGTFRFRGPLNREPRFTPLRLHDAPIKGSLAQFLYINWRR